VDACLDLIGPMEVGERIYDALTGFAFKDGPLNLATGGRAAEERVGVGDHGVEHVVAAAELEHDQDRGLLDA